MSDEEWERWQQAWAQGGRPLPRVLARARSDRTRALVGVILIWVIAIAEVGWAIQGIVAGRITPIDLASRVVVIVGTVAIVGGTHLVMRGTLGASGANGAAPEALLQALRARHRGRLRLKKVLYAVAAFLIVSTCALAAWRAAEDGFVWAYAVAALVPSGLVVLAVAVVSRRVERVILAELQEADAVEQMLAEDAVTFESTPPTR